MYRRKEQFLQTLKAFTTAYSFAEARRILEAHPELLSDEADTMLGELIQFTRRQGDNRVVRLFEERRALLRRCREVGVTQAFAEREKRVNSLAKGLHAFIMAPTPSKARCVLEAHPELLSDEADAMLGELIRFAETRGATLIAPRAIH